MTIGGWIFFGILAVTILGFSIFAACDLDSASGKALAISIGIILIAAIGAGFHWYFNSTAAGQRAAEGGGPYEDAEIEGQMGFVEAGET